MITGSSAEPDNEPGGETITEIQQVTAGVACDGRVRLEWSTNSGDRHGVSLWPGEARAYAAMLDVAANEADRRAGRRDFAAGVVDVERGADRAYVAGMAAERSAVVDRELQEWSPDAATWSPEAEV